MSSPSELLLSAWQAKVNLDWESCFGLLVELKNSLGIPPGQLVRTDVERLLPPEGSSSLIDTLVLQSAVARQSGNPEYGDFLLSELERLFDLGLAKPTFRFCHERGLQNLLRGHFSPALENFLRSGQLAGSDLERLWTKINVIFCLDNLGLPWEKTWTEFDVLYRALKSKENLSRVEDQLGAFLARRAFREGRLEDVFEKAKTQDRFGQDDYFRSFVSLLPYHDFYRPKEVENSLETLLANFPGLRYSSYRLRTLRGLLSPDDSQTEKPSEWVDRLYAWTWRWLVTPTDFGVEKPLRVLKSLNLSDLAHRLTAEDEQELRNAVLWLGLFDRSSSRLVSSLCSNLPNATSSQYLIFQLENYVLYYLHALRDQNTVLVKDYGEQLRSHPLWTSKHFRFRALVDAVEEATELPKTDPLFLLAANLRKLCFPHSQTFEGLQVNLEDFAIQQSGENQRIVSAPLALALEALYRNPVLSCEDFLTITFGIRRYDALIHAPKVFNLLSRLKKVAPSDLKFRVKEGRVIAEGSWEQVQFIPRKQASLNLAHQTDWREWLVTSVPALSLVKESHGGPRALTTSFEKVSWQNGVTREEVEAATGRPRSTVNRLLKQWLEEGKIRKTGLSRKTRYFLRGSDAVH